MMVRTRLGYLRAASGIPTARLARGFSAQKLDSRRLVSALEAANDDPELTAILDGKIGVHFKNHAFPRGLFPKLLSVAGLMDWELPAIEARLDLLVREGILSTSPMRGGSGNRLWVGQDESDRPAATIAELLTVLQVISETHPKLETSNFLHVDVMVTQILAEAKQTRHRLLAEHGKKWLEETPAAEAWEAGVYKAALLVQSLYDQKLGWKYGRFIW